MEFMVLVYIINSFCIATAVVSMQPKQVTPVKIALWITIYLFWWLIVPLIVLTNLKQIYERGSSERSNGNYNRNDNRRNNRR